MHPTDEQIEALVRFYTPKTPKYGTRPANSWKRDLRELWEKACAGHPDGGLLQQLRNNLGPRWLTAFRPGDTKVGYLVLHGHGEYRIEDVDCGPLVDGGFTSKTAARRAAQRYKITLLEDEND